jgi:hypothetical protein
MLDQMLSRAMVGPMRLYGVDGSQLLLFPASGAGEKTMAGGRQKRVREHLGNTTF